MSVSYSALTVAGVLFKDLKPQKVTKRSTVTRYDPVTGEPFEKEIITDLIRLGNKEFEFKDYDDLVSYLSGNGDEEFENFSLNYVGDIRDNEFEDCVVLGYPINYDSADSWNHGISLIDEAEIEVAKARAKEWFKNYLLCEADIKLYTVLSCSY
jgi:hypothetical protein